MPSTCPYKMLITHSAMLHLHQWSCFQLHFINEISEELFFPFRLCSWNLKTTTIPRCNWKYIKAVFFVLFCFVFFFPLRWSLCCKLPGRRRRCRPKTRSCWRSRRGSLRWRLNSRKWRENSNRWIHCGKKYVWIELFIRFDSMMSSCPF